MAHKTLRIAVNTSKIIKLLAINRMDNYFIGKGLFGSDMLTWQMARVIMDSSCYRVFATSLKG